MTLKDSCDWQEYTIERGSGTAESRRGRASGLLLRDLEWTHVTTRMTRVAPVERCGERNGEGYRSDPEEEGFHSRAAFPQLLH